MGSYVAWSQYQADQRATLKKQQTEQALAAKAEIKTFEGFVNYGNPTVAADGLAGSSKSISDPIFTTRTVGENEAPDISAPDLIGGSKSWAHATVPGSSLPRVPGKGFEESTWEKPPATVPYADFEPDPNAGFGMISGSKSIGRAMTWPIPNLDRSEDEESSESNTDGQ